MLSYFKGRRVAKRYLAPYRSALDMERGGGGGGGGGGSRYAGEEESMLPNPLYYTNSSPYP